ncbi:hypothetical protein BRARA_B02294 [Brassica rapa]|uniref:RNase H type-1 domain-containing protein n=1 Tax=Brassica campestris TaxID=3711 RepID=A0A398ABR0_BRACM|nr:hypothetical protein BRARA_B02294 [Brassica rapa]
MGVFLWRVNSGALAVKSRLVTRGIHLDPTCSVCEQSSETICHVLFHCKTAKEVWERSNVPPPPAGCKTSALGPCLRQAFPWILWHLWKARNAFCYERSVPDPSVILRRAMEDAAIWLNLHDALPHTEPLVMNAEPAQVQWQKPPASFVKCNVGSSWDVNSNTGGGAWIVRDDKGLVLCHSRRSFSMVGSLYQANVMALQWAAEAMCDLKFKKVVMEFSALEVKKAMDSSLLFSVTRDQRLQSYVARNGPAWLSSQICQEAST